MPPEPFGQSAHPFVVGEDLAAETANPLLPRLGDQMLQQSGPHAVALDPIHDGHRQLRRLRCGRGADAPSHAEYIGVLSRYRPADRREGEMVAPVRTCQIRQIRFGQDALRTEKP